ncbi:AraC family transcriptional regulator [Clostridium sp. AL.422]|uniref:AraC family transcriptional regulator n=1 Tax=Clostridium TaxID=1485 RepID=UPI00293DE288|nr:MULTISPECIES: AraC family transcriptional regulator [unclassified Clostridium]MDV4152134.1 AraC family transcriptional regulator [Clostridium sp. AL.422]
MILILDAYFLENNNRNFNDMYLWYCGFEKCSPEHSFGPAVRPNYLLHYVLDGKGYYYVDNKKYTVCKNQGFLIAPNVVTFYHADNSDPWTYLWLGIDGNKVEFYLKSVGLDENNLIFTSESNDELKGYVMEMLKHHKITPYDSFKIEGLLYLFFSNLAKYNNSVSFNNENASRNMYINKAMEFIQHNYFSSIKVADIANYVCLNRSYLTSIFQKQLNMSPQQFLMEYRIRKGADLLITTDLSIRSISYSCGYTDSSTFSKAFKKLKGISPNEYRLNKKFSTSKLLAID